MVNYVRLAKTAERLINKNGRTVTFRKTLVDPDNEKPWNGSDAGFLDIPIKAVFVSPTTTQQFGLSALGEGTQYDDLFKHIQLTAMFSPGDHDIRQFTSVIDTDGSEYGVIAYQLLNPGDIKIIGYLGMRR